MNDDHCHTEMTSSIRWSGIVFIIITLCFLAKYAIDAYVKVHAPTAIVGRQMRNLKLVIGGPLDGGHLPRTDSEYCMLTFYSDDADGAMNYVYRQRVGYWSFEPGDAQAAARAGLHGGEPPTAIVGGRE